jgi:hypothetical protein
MPPVRVASAGEAGLAPNPHDSPAKLPNRRQYPTSVAPQQIVASALAELIASALGIEPPVTATDLMANSRTDTHNLHRHAVLKWAPQSRDNSDDGVDTFVFRDGLIPAQTVRYTLRKTGDHRSAGRGAPPRSGW